MQKKGSTIKISDNKHQKAASKYLLVCLRNVSVNILTAEQTIEVDAFKIITKIGC